MVLGDTNTNNQNQSVRSNPFLLYDGDQPGQSLVGDEVLTGSNYHIWLPLMTLALRVKNKIRFVDGTLPKPPANDQTSTMWSCCNSMVMSWITSSVSEDIRNTIMYHKTAQAMWSALKDRYHRNDNFRIYQIKKELWNLKQHESMDINEYFTKFITLWNELKYYKPPVVCTCGGAKEALEKYEEEECLTQFLIGVNQSHRQTIDMILTKDPLPDVYWALKHLEFEESQRPIGSGPYKNSNPFFPTRPRAPYR